MKQLCTHTVRHISAAVCLAAGLSVGALPALAAQTASAASTSSTVKSTEASSRSVLTPEQASAMLADPRMVLVNQKNKLPDDYTVETKKCGSATSINSTLQTEAAEAFLKMQKAAAKDGVTIWMQSGYRSVSYQEALYNNKVQYYINKGYSKAAASKKAATIVNPPGYSEHNSGLAADLNCPQHTDLTEGFADTNAFSWLCAHADDYGFILRYSKDAESVTGITYEPWHWRYVGVKNAQLIKASGLCLEDSIAVLKALAEKDIEVQLD